MRQKLEPWQSTALILSQPLRELKMFAMKRTANIARYSSSSFSYEIVENDIP